MIKKIFIKIFDIIFYLEKTISLLLIKLEKNKYSMLILFIFFIILLYYLYSLIYFIMTFCFIFKDKRYIKRISKWICLFFIISIVFNNYPLVLPCLFIILFLYSFLVHWTSLEKKEYNILFLLLFLRMFINILLQRKKKKNSFRIK